MKLDEIRSKIALAEAEAGRALGSVELIAVSKLQPNDRVEAVLNAGHLVFGENRVQEAAAKWPGFKDRYPGTVLHLLGQLQSNKARQAMEIFDVIHTLDREKLIGTLSRLAQETGRCPSLFVQVNIGEEPQKSGVAPGDVDGFVAKARSNDLPLVGAMCIPPQDAPPEPYFAQLAEIAHRNGLPQLSMGMSADYEVAIAHGATHVRVGSALFGERP